MVLVYLEYPGKLSKLHQGLDFSVYLQNCIDLGWSTVFANVPGDLGSIPGRVIPKTQKMVLDATSLNIQHYKVRIKSKMEQSRERSSALPYTLV